MKRWILIVVAIQFLALLSIAVKREWIHSQGETVFLRTAPVDPRDLFRGDYVQLQYDIGFPDASKISDELTRELEVDDKTHRQVFVSLTRNSNGVAEIDGIHSNKPKGAIFIKGQTGYRLWRRWRQNGNIKYGIEKYFVEQGSGTVIEDKRGRAQQWQTALEVEVALGGGGTAVIKGHRWSDLGVKLEVLETATTRAPSGNNAPPQRRNPKITMHMRNQSNHPIGLVDTTSHCSFKLIQNQNPQLRLAAAVSTYSFPQRDCDTESQTVHTLAPGDVYLVTLDFEDSRWFVEHDNKHLSIADIPSGFLGFRLVFQPPKGVVLPQVDEVKIWDSNIRSARFLATGRID